MSWITSRFGFPWNYSGIPEVPTEVVRDDAPKLAAGDKLRLNASGIVVTVTDCQKISYGYDYKYQVKLDHGDWMDEKDLLKVATLLPKPVGAFPSDPAKYDEKTIKEFKP